jgi:hypothetical protein
MIRHHRRHITPGRRTSALSSRSALVLWLAGVAAAGAQAAPGTGAPAAGLSQLTVVTCASTSGEQQHCAADTSGGIILLRTIGTNACLLGRSWGYDDRGVWVTEGCSGEFAVRAPLVGEAAPPSAPPASAETADPQTAEEERRVTPQSGPAGAAPESEEAAEAWGAYDPGQGFLVGRARYGELSVSAYAMARYMNQNDSDGVYTDHFGNEKTVDTRHDIFSHRVIAYLMGWVGDPKLRYTIFLWTLNATDQDAIFANLGYQFNKHFNLYTGIVGNPGTRSIQGSHPYWLAHDRVMADEFFRPYFGVGVWANGQVAPGLFYQTTLTNSSSALGITASQLDRKLQTVGASMWWMPTTHEFGPRGGYGDYEWHEKVATRFGFGYVTSPEQSFSDSTGRPGNTTIKLTDGLNIFETGSLAPGVTISELDYRILSMDAGVKYRGIFVQAEYYRRWLDAFEADGALPTDELVEDGFYVQAAFYPLPKKLELYGATSQIFAEESLGFRDSSEYIAGLNWFPWDTRNHRLNLQLMDVNRSPAGSTFGFYTTGQDGITASTAFSIFF